MSEALRKKIFGEVQKLVIKIGTGVLTNDNGTLDLAAIHSICEQVHTLCERGIQVILVTSGAIGAGMGALGLKRRPTLLPELQATAAIGQNRLMVAYDEALQKYGLHAGQVLLTREDLEDRRRFVNIGNTINALLRMGVVPVVNENDTVSVDEIKFGGNDVLAAQVLHVLKADAIVFLSTVDGLFGADGKTIDVVKKVTADTLGLDTGSKSSLGIGGMQTKLESIREITDSGEAVVIANGKEPDAIVRVIDGERIGTLFCPAEARLAGRKRWIRFSVKSRGTVIIDEGAVRALVDQHKSLLASGISSIKGRFEQGDLVSVTDTTGCEVAKGIINYSAEELHLIKGAKTCEIESRLGYKYYDEAIHRDNLVLTEIKS